MAAANTDLFKKLSRRWVGQIGAGGVADNTTTTVPLSSATNLPTGTAVVVVIDRVDSNGTSTASLEETVIGIVSGSNLISCVRGAEGTAQAHNAGAVVEVLFTAKGWNDLIDGLLVEHNQLGGHTNITACNITASGTLTVPNITASGTLTVPNITASGTITGKVTALKSATTSIDVASATAPSSGQVLTATSSTAATWQTPSTGALTSKVISFSRDLTTASGDVAYTGVGFTPNPIHFIATGENVVYHSQGFSDSAKGGNGRYYITTTAAGAMATDVVANCVIMLAPSSGNSNYAIVKTYDADGFTLTWTKQGSPTGTTRITAICYK